MWHALIERWQGFSNEQKISVVLLSVCGSLALGLSLYRVNTNVTRPFLVDKTDIVTAKGLIGETPQEAEARLKRTDTDGDTISDWDETNLTLTNPNLRDSCGDGLPDNVRIAVGKTGDCGSGVSGNLGSGDASGKANGSLNPLFPVDTSAANFTTTTLGVAQAKTLQEVVPRDPKSIREALRGQVDQEKLDALTDKELLELYDQAIAVQTGQSATTTTTP